MNSIIWSMSSQNDTLGNMVAYIRSYTIEYLEGTGIKPTIQIPEIFPALVVRGTIRRNIFLLVKEALQNIVKHAEATEVVICMNEEPMGYSLTIHDNGKGIDLENIRQFSNGLKNMRKRMEDFDIDFSIENKNGTLIRLYKQTH
jgi:signal transduction histidine kinase